MSKLTNKLKLYLPGGGSTGLNTPTEQVDIDKINGNFESIDAAIGAVQVSSTTHPAVPYDGLVIRESDTNNTLIYSSDASKYLPVGIPNVASDAARNALYPSPIQGIKVNRIDKGYIEQYYNVYNASTNKLGWRTAGWFPELSGRTLIPLTSDILTVASTGTAVFTPGGSCDMTDIATDVNLDNLFWDGMFQSYEFQLEITAVAGDGDVMVRARSGGTSDATGRYTYGLMELSPAGASTTYKGTQNIIAVGRVAAAGGGSCLFRLSQWAKAISKSYTFGQSSDGGSYTRTVNGAIGGSVQAWDGFLLTVHNSGGTSQKFSGRLTVHGLFSG